MQVRVLSWASAAVAQMEEHILGKNEVRGSNPLSGLRAYGVIGNVVAFQAKVPGSSPGRRTVHMTKVLIQ